jgi:hypothetical protein
VPDPALTPQGEMDPSLACVSNRDRPRGVTDAEKNALLVTYGYPKTTKKSSGEFDHWLPNWAYGSMSTLPHNRSPGPRLVGLLVSFD